MSDHPETPDEKSKRNELIEAAKVAEALRLKKHNRGNAENNTDDAIRKRTDTDPFTGE